MRVEHNYKRRIQPTKSKLVKAKMKYQREELENAKQKECNCPNKKSRK